MSDFWQEVPLRAMGVVGQLILGDAPDGLDRWAVGELERLEQCWSRFRPDGELCSLNVDPRPEVPVSSTLAEAVATAVSAWQTTGGACDASVIDALEQWGYDRTFAEVRGRSGMVQRPLRSAPTTGLDGVGVGCHPGLRWWVRRPPGVRLDLGGIGKGLALDMVADGLLARGARSVSIALGGDIRLAGEVPDAGWSVPVEDPWRDDAIVLTVVLGTGAGVVASTVRHRRWQHPDGTWSHHLIDPASGRPTDTDVAAAVVVAATAWEAEALAKSAVVRGGRDGADLLSTHAEGAWLAGADGRLRSVDCSVTPAVREGAPA